MKQMLLDSVYFGVLLTLGAYAIGMMLKRKLGWSILNPLLIAIILIIAFLAIMEIPYASYNASANLVSYLLTPATICLAVPLYQQVELLKKNYKAVVAGIVSGVLSSMISVLALALLFRFDHVSYVTFLPKSITTAIGMGISAELGGFVPLTVVAIVLTGIFGSLVADKVLHVLHIEEPIAKGIAIGSASHAMGTAHAMELGQVEGAMSGLSIVVSGIVTVLAATLFSWIM